MTCKSCPHYKPMDAVAILDGAPSFACDKTLADCGSDDLACLLKIVIWKLVDIEDLLECEDA